MAKKTKSQENRLGTGLAAIFGEDVTDVLDEIQTGAKSEEYGRKAVLNISEIRSNPYQPRKVFDDDKLKELADSIKVNGVFQPILVRKAVGGYELIAGERRLKASGLAGKTEIPAIIMDFNDEQMMEISLLENIQREDLNPIEEAMGYDQLMNKLGYTQEVLSQRVGKSRETIANSLRLLKLPAEVQKLLSDKKLTVGQVRPLITLPSEKSVAIAKRIVAEGLTSRQVEALVSTTKKVTKKDKKETNPYLIDAKKSLEQKFSTKVKISDSAISISYNDQDDLNRILEILDIIED